MPYEYVIDPEHRLVRSRAWGHVTGAELLDQQRRLWRDQQFSGDLSQLIDARDVTNTIDITAGVIESIARQTRYGPGSRRAIVAPVASTYGVARMYQSHCESSGSAATIRVFRTLEDALNWLSVPRQSPQGPSRTPSEPFEAPTRTDPPWQPEPGELLFAFVRGRDRFLCELRDHGHWGVEAQFFKNEAFILSRRLDTREQAVQWATIEREAIEKGEA